MAPDESEPSAPCCERLESRVFPRDLSYVLFFDAKAVRYAAESWPARSALISSRVAARGEKNEGICVSQV